MRADQDVFFQAPQTRQDDLSDGTSAPAGVLYVECSWPIDQQLFACIIEQALRERSRVELLLHTCSYDAREEGPASTHIDQLGHARLVRLSDAATEDLTYLLRGHAAEMEHFRVRWAHTYVSRGDQAYATGSSHKERRQVSRGPHVVDDQHSPPVSDQPSEMKPRLIGIDQRGPRVP